MFRYVLAAQALRAFSINATTMRAYRGLGNLFGGKSRSKTIEPHYIARARGNLEFIESLGAIRDGMTILELGTGWVHWEALFTRLFYDVRTYLFDIWDNRQFAGFLRYATHLRESLYAEVQRPREQLDRAAAILDRLVECADFEQVYELLDFTYIIDPQGRLDALASQSIDLIISSDVLEHIPRAGLESLVIDVKRVLKPGGVFAALIVEEDHLRIYDASIHRKNYLRYSDFVWKSVFENKVQYINRLQHSDYLNLFGTSLEIVDQRVVATSPELPFVVADPFKKYGEDDLKAGVTRIAARA